PASPTSSAADSSAPASSVSAASPTRGPELSLELPAGSTSLTFNQLLQLESLAERLTEVQAARAAQGLPAPIVEITGEHAAHVAELLAREVSLEITVAPGRPNAADVHLHLDDADPGTPAPGVDDQLLDLVTAAMEDASPLMKSVNSVLTSNPQKYLHHESGLHLLRASVVLDTRTDEIADLISRHGVDHVADAFVRQFERPIIETAQREAFTDTEAGRAAFGAWAHQLWDTINNTPQLAQDPELLAGEIFNHDKGYNRATNFAQQAALASIMGPPPLAETVANRARPDEDTSARAMWLFQVLADAKLIPADASVSPEQFTAAINDNRAELEAGIGVELTDRLTAELREELQSYGMVDDASDTDEPGTSAPAISIDDQLTALTTSAMENASPLMKLVESTLRSNPQKYLHHEAGLHLLRASVVLHTRADEITGLMAQHGLDAVARAFNQQFERPVIETEQLRAFDAGDRTAFGIWAHQLWDTIDNTPRLAGDPEELAGEIFNHDKGYNRATNFAQQVALAAVMGPPPLGDAISQRPVQGDDHAAWVYQVFTDAGLIAADGTDTATRFTELVHHHRADLEPALGQLDDQRIAELRQELVDMVMLDDDVPSQADPVGDTLRYLAKTCSRGPLRRRRRRTGCTPPSRTSRAATRRRCGSTW
ncbi:hypothetical protein, partial [Lentzea indica]|uniref:hypothetical protein n=1 Tax=Lentzea indica TaxID=2604800 RepID=UPI00143AD143